jgi:hypothetical protein
MTYNDSQALPNSGVEATIEVVANNGVGSAWVSDTMSNNLWGQVGYDKNPNSKTGIGAFFQVWDLNFYRITSMNTKTIALQPGKHKFAMYSKGSTVWTFSVDGRSIGSFDMRTNTSVSVGGMPIYAEVESCSAPTYPIGFSSINVLKSGIWQSIGANFIWQ